MSAIFARFMKDESGATAIEYGLLSAVMAVALLSGFGALSNALSDQFVYFGSIINY